MRGVSMSDPYKAVDDRDQDRSVLLQAHDIVRGRDKGYGNPVDTAVRVARSFKNITGRNLYPRDVSLIQTLYKIIRSEHSYRRDNQVDQAGYTDIRERTLKYEIDHPEELEDERLDCSKY